MKPGTLRDIRHELDAIPGDMECLGNPQLCFDLVEERAISILDSRHTDFAPGVLEDHLLGYLHLRLREYGLLENPNPGGN